MTKAALYIWHRAGKGFNRIGDIGYAVQSDADAGFSVVRESVATAPAVNARGPGGGPPTPSGPRPPPCAPVKTIAILFPVICQYDCKITQAKDGWTVKTKDGGLAAHFEHSNAILKDHTEIMTRRMIPILIPRPSASEVLNRHSIPRRLPETGGLFCIRSRSFVQF